ncbi:MAG: hypothetical protein WB706_05625, partial [Nitrososphaeraceae archaeon]
ISKRLDFCLNVIVNEGRNYFDQIWDSMSIFTSWTSTQSPTIDTRTDTWFTAKLGDQLSEMSGLTDGGAVCQKYLTSCSQPSRVNISFSEAKIEERIGQETLDKDHISNRT